MIAWINKKRNKKGFTLIELIVVIAILGILAAIAIPRLTGTRNTANRSAVIANLRTIESALSIAAAEGQEITELKGTDTPAEDPEDPPIPDSTSLVGRRYLADEPTGPKGVTKYDVKESRAIVVFDADDQFGFNVTAGTEYTLGELEAD